MKIKGVNYVISKAGIPVCTAKSIKTVFSYLEDEKAITIGYYGFFDRYKRKRLIDENRVIEGEFRINEVPHYVGEYKKDNE